MNESAIKATDTLTALFDKGIIRKIFAENIAQVYDFDLDALAPLAAEFGPTPDEIAVPLDQVPADSVSPAFTR